MLHRVFHMKPQAMNDAIIVFGSLGVSGGDVLSSSCAIGREIRNILMFKQAGFVQLGHACAISSF